MDDIGIFLPTISGIGGVERIAYILGRELGIDTYTSSVNCDLETYFPGMDNHVVTISKSNSDKSLISIVKDFKHLETDVKLMIYLYPRSIYFSHIRKDIPYLYYLGGIPHEYYMDSTEYKQFLGSKITYSDYLNKFVWKNVVKQIDHKRVIANSKLIFNIYTNIIGHTPGSLLYPPIDTNNYNNRDSDDFYLSVGRLEPYKRVEWQIKAFEGSKERLIIIGNGSLYDKYSKYLKDNKIDNIKILNSVGQDELVDYYSRSKAFVFTSYNEHFGLTPLEAMASGKPVLSVREGGPLEYILDNVNGFFFDDISGLKTLIETLPYEKLKMMKHECEETAKKFDTSKFIACFRELTADFLS